jgi:hypothetical protein
MTRTTAQRSAPTNRVTDRASRDRHHDHALADRGLTNTVDARFAGGTRGVRAAGDAHAAVGVRVDRAGAVVCRGCVALLIRTTRGALIARNRLARTGGVATEARIAAVRGARRAAHRADAGRAARVCNRVAMLPGGAVLVVLALLARRDSACRSLIGPDAREVTRTVAVAMTRVTVRPATCDEDETTEEVETVWHVVGASNHRARSRRRDLQPFPVFDLSFSMSRRVKRSSCGRS